MCVQLAINSREFLCAYMEAPELNKIVPAREPGVADVLFNWKLIPHNEDDVSDGRVFIRSWC